MRIHNKRRKTLLQLHFNFLTLEDVELNQRGQQYILVQNDLNKLHANIYMHICYYYYNIINSGNYPRSV